MSDDQMLKCLIAFILGYFLCKMMGNGFSVGAQVPQQYCRCPPGQYWDNSTNKCLFKRNEVDICNGMGNDECVKSWHEGLGLKWKCTYNPIFGKGGCVESFDLCSGECLHGEDRTKCTDFCI